MGLFTTNFDIFSYFYECYAPCEQPFYKFGQNLIYQTSITEKECQLIQLFLNTDQICRIS